MYSIKVSYIECDSFGSYDMSEEVGMNWKSLEKAQLALSFLHEHQEAYESNKNEKHKSPRDFFDVMSISNKPWFYKDASTSPCRFAWENILLVEMDNGEFTGISPFWLSFMGKFNAAIVIGTEKPEKESDDVRDYL